MLVLHITFQNSGHYSGHMKTKEASNAKIKHAAHLICQNITMWLKYVLITNFCFVYTTYMDWYNNYMHALEQFSLHTAITRRPVNAPQNHLKLPV